MGNAEEKQENFASDSAGDSKQAADEKGEQAEDQEGPAEDKTKERTQRKAETSGKQPTADGSGRASTFLALNVDALRDSPPGEPLAGRAM